MRRSRVIWVLAFSLGWGVSPVMAQRGGGSHGGAGHAASAAHPSSSSAASSPASPGSSSSRSFSSTRSGGFGRSGAVSRFGSRGRRYFYGGLYTGLPYDNFWEGEPYDTVLPPVEEAGGAAAGPSGPANTPVRDALNAIATPRRSPAQPKVIDVPGSEEPSAQELPPTVFIFANGNQMEARRFTLTSNALAIEVDSHETRHFPLTALNLQATLAANSERGISLKIPEDRNHIAIGF
jgi:hypothetical protein